MLEIRSDRIVFLDNKGDERPITSPWSGNSNPLLLSREMEEHWAFLGGSSSEAGAFIDFINLRGLSRISRWRINQNGEYLSQEHFATSNAGVFAPREMYEVHTDCRNLSLLARRYSNDYQIYCAVKYILGLPAEAQGYLDKYAPETVLLNNKKFRRDHGGLHATIVFNHNYSRNIPRLQEMYSDRFSHIQYVLPNACPSSENCLSFPAGSFAYHTLIYSSIISIISSDKFNKKSWYMFCQDDVYLNRRFSLETMAEFISDIEACAAFYLPVDRQHWDYESDWSWNTRILRRIREPRSAEFGNGFEGYDGFFDEERLASGMGDIFFVNGSYLEEFAALLGNYISADIFPEVAIPSALKALRFISGKNLSLFTGLYLWGRDRDVVNKQYTDEFDKGMDLFIHPFKLDMAQP